MRQLRRLGADSAPTLPPPCVSCTHWETFPAAPDLADQQAEITTMNQLLTQL